MLLLERRQGLRFQLAELLLLLGQVKLERTQLLIPLSRRRRGLQLLELLSLLAAMELERAQLLLRQSGSLSQRSAWQ